MKINFQVKTFFYIVPLVLTFSMIFVAVYFAQQSALLEEELISKGLLMARNLSSGSELAIFTENQQYLTSYMDGIQEERFLAYASVYTIEGKVIDARFNEEVDLSLDEKVISQLTGEKNDFHVRPGTGVRNRFHDFFAPVTSSCSRRTENIFSNGSSGADSADERTSAVIGFVRVGISHDFVSERQADILELSLYLMSISLLLGILASYLLAKRITGPVTILMEHVRGLRYGWLDRVVPIRSQDEIGELATNFDALWGELMAREAELKRWARTLERQVEARTQEIKSANRELEDKNRRLDDFTYVVSHDLKEPLRGIEAFCGFLKKHISGKLDEEGVHYLDVITASTRRMKSLIEDLLTLSRLARGKLRIENVETVSVVEDVCEGLQYAIAEKGVEVRVDPLPRTRGDKVRIGEVFYNLIANAMRFNDKPNPFVHVGSHKEGARAGEVVMYVRDNGVGIDCRYHDRIFQIFQRLERREDGGTGAGLTIVKKIVEDHGGRIWVESEPGQGSTFYFTLLKAEGG